MGRQRTIDDAGFWRSPQIAARSQEDKATLLYLLTSPFSNIVGVYQMIPRVAAAEMGWTSEQLLPVLERLTESNLIEFDEQSCSVWIKVWWDHNSARMAVGPALRAKTCEQIEQIIPRWREAYLVDFVTRLPEKDGLRASVERHLLQGMDTVSTPCRYRLDSGPPNTTRNHISINTTNDPRPGGESLEFPKLSESEVAALRAKVELLPSSMRQDVLDEIEGKRRAGRLKAGALALCAYFQKNPAAFVLTDGKLIQRERADRHAIALRDAAFGAEIDRALVAMSDTELQTQQARLPGRVAEKTVARRQLLQSELDSKSEGGM